MKPTMIVLGGPFTDADIIQCDELRDPSPATSCEAARIVATRRAVLMADRGMVFDNSRLDRPPSHCLTFESGRLVWADLAVQGRRNLASDLMPLEKSLADED